MCERIGSRDMGIKSSSLWKFEPRITKSASKENWMETPKCTKNKKITKDWEIIQRLYPNTLVKYHISFYTNCILVRIFILKMVLDNLLQKVTLTVKRKHFQINLGSIKQFLGQNLKK